MKKLTIGIMIMAVLAFMARPAFAAGNFVHDNGTVTYSNASAAISSGNLVDLGDRYGIAAADIASNAIGTVFTKGIWSLARADTNAIAAGAKVFYASVSTVDGTATADEYVGLCAEAVAVCTALTNSLGEVNKYVWVDLNAPQRQSIVGTDVQAYDADLTRLAGNNGGSITGLPITVTSETGAITATGTVTLVKQTVSLTDTNGVTALVVTNVTGTVTINVIGGGAVVTNATATNP